MNWREGYAQEKDTYRRCDILRAVLKVENTAQEISDIVDRMVCLPIGLQSHIAWDVIGNPRTTAEIYKRVKNNAGLLSMTSAENIRLFWKLNHEGRCVMNKNQRDQVGKLIYTSVDDMKSGLWSYTDLTALRAALRTSKRRGEKTRVKILAAHIKKLEKKKDERVKVQVKVKSLELHIESDPGECSRGYDMKG